MTYGPWPDDIAFEELVDEDWLTKVSQSFAHMELVAEALQTSPVSIDVTTAAGSALLVSLGALSLEAIPYVVEFDVPFIDRVQTAANSPSVFVGLYDNGSAVRSKLRQVKVHLTQVGGSGCGGSYIWTPVAGTRTPQLRAYTNTADEWTAQAGGADGDTYGPISMRLYRQTKE